VAASPNWNGKEQTMADERPRIGPEESHETYAAFKADFGHKILRLANGTETVAKKRSEILRLCGCHQPGDEPADASSFADNAPGAMESQRIGRDQAKRLAETAGLPPVAIDERFLDTLCQPRRLGETIKILETRVRIFNGKPSTPAASGITFEQFAEGLAKA
jgi:hypothetical protein